MNDLALQIAGCVAVMAALGHGFLGDKMLAHQQISPPRLKNFIRLCYLFGSAGWLAGGVLFFIAPAVMSEAARWWIVLTFVPVYGFGALVNVWFTQGRHLGWVLLLVVVGLALLGM